MVPDTCNASPVRLRQEDCHKLEAILGCRVKPFSKNKFGEVAE